jgi:beta-lactam-binding protein with PASTA domain
MEKGQMDMKRMNRTQWAGMAAIALVVGFTGCTSKVAVPQLEGLDLKAATAALQSAGLQPGPLVTEFTGGKASGTVLRQTPAAATPVAKGSTVFLTVEENIVVPSLVGMDLATARQTMEKAGLRLQKLEKKFVGGTLSNVVSQTPPAGERVEFRGAVDLVIDEFVVVPDYVDQNLSEVRKAVAQAGLRLGPRTTKAAPQHKPGTILDQSPEVGAKVPPGTAITFEVVAAPGETPVKPAATAGKDPVGTLVGTNSNTADKLLALAETALDLATNSKASKEATGTNSVNGTGGAQDKQNKTAERVRTGISILGKLFGSKE